MDCLGEGEYLEFSGDPVAEAGVDAVQLGGLDNRREDVHGASAAAVQARIATPRAHTGLKLR